MIYCFDKPQLLLNYIYYDQQSFIPTLASKSSAHPTGEGRSANKTPTYLSEEVQERRIKTERARNPNFDIV